MQTLAESLTIDGKQYDAGGIYKEAVPKHVAIIMDGNGRWATRRGKPRTYGHQVGAETLKTIIKASQALGIKALTAYSFSTENWKRPKLEVELLMMLLDKYLTNEIEEMHQQNVKIMFSGDLSRLSSKLQKKMAFAVEYTKNNTDLVLNLAINYGSRAEILRAAKLLAVDLANGKVDPTGLEEKDFDSYLYTSGLPDVDLLIRPGGDMRISNFLLWQIAYAEIWLTDCFWPDFSPATLIEAVREFQRRDRRFGGLNKK